VVGKRGYPQEFRRKVLDLIEAGRPVVDVARDLDISAQPIYVWRRQNRIDKGLELNPIALRTRRGGSGRRVQRSPNVF